MQKKLLIIIVAIAFAGILFAQESGITRISYNNIPRTESPNVQSKPKKQSAAQPKRRKIDFMADEVRPFYRGKDSIVCFTGNFAAHHNGAVISCDSAVRFNDTHWGFYDKVVINQDSIYIYGDSAIYDGNISLAEVYAPIVKVVDGDALLYTYDFFFNTQTKIGRYTKGGVLVQDNDILESWRGYYYADTHDIICVDQVEIHGSDYDLKSDSVIYNTDTKFAQFFTNSEIWNVDGDYLSAEEGTYDGNLKLYNVTRDGYILTAEQEIWGDTLTYDRLNEYIIARRNIQMDDFENKVLALGDYGEYWREQGRALLTQNPIAFSYDTTEYDSVFIKADTMWFETRNREYDKRMAVIKAREDSIRAIEEARLKAEEEARLKAEALAAAEAREKERAEAEARAKAEAEAEAALLAKQDVAQESQTEPAEQSTPTTDSVVKEEQTVTDSESKAEATATPPADDATQEAPTVTEEQKSESEQPTIVADSVSNVSVEAPADVVTDAGTEQVTDGQESEVTLSEEVLDQERSEKKKRKLKEKRSERKRKTEAEVEQVAEQPVMTAEDSLRADSLARVDSIRIQLALDSIVNDSLYPDSILSPTQLQARMEKRAADAKAEELRIKAEERRIFLDSIAKQRQAKMIAQYERDRAFELRQFQKDSVRRAKKRAKREARGKDVSDLQRQDSLDAIRMEELRREIVIDTASVEVEEDIMQDSLQVDSIAVDTMPQDSIYRLVKAYRNVRIYRSDAQAVCDSMVGNSTDSVVRMYLAPVLWNNLNQIAAEQVDMYTKNQQLERVEFMENPVMIAEIDTVYYNQVTGKKMIAYFRDNDIYRNDVDGNVQTIYFQQESEESKIVTNLIYLESASASFYLEKQELKGITYRNDVPFTIYPLAMIPEDQPTRLPNFKWVPELRPQRVDFVIEGLRPSLRERTKSRQRPTFRIVNRMDRDKERYIRRGVWIDREDQLKPEIVEWRNTRVR